MGKSFDEFKTPEELYNYYGINIVNESAAEDEIDPDKYVEEFQWLYEADESTEEPKEEKTEDTESKSKKNSDVNAAITTDDVSEAEYGDYTNIFKHIIVFTNEKDTKNNKTLKNIYDAVKNLKKAKQLVPELHIFTAADVVASDDESEITIKDDDEELTIKNENNTDTLVFARLSVQGEDNCEHIVELLQDRGFLVLNPLKYSAIACNKYDTAVLLEKGEIPQPNFCLMTKDVLYDEKLFNESIKRLYKDWDLKDPDKNEDKDVVCKILDGHGGTGVALIDGKRLTAWLQMIFAIDSERQLILQKREQADGGDLRVHVLTLRDKQVILAAMKRVKIGGDFRSNVSLGASAEPVELTEEQKDIALKTAKLSCMPWCAVDIMPLVKGSNKEKGDNVVLEINASPGTDGISEVINYNFINVLLNELKDPKEFYLQNKVAGYLESVNIKFGEGDGVDMLALLDTGNGAKASHVEVGDYKINGKKVSFTLMGQSYTLDIIDWSNPVGAGGQADKRPIVKIPEIRLGLRVAKDIEMAIVKERDKGTNVLLNRTLLGYLGYSVNSDKTHILTTAMEKIKIV